MDGGVSRLKDGHKGVDVDLVDVAEPLREKTEKLFVGPLLSAAIDDHVGQLGLVAGFHVHLEQLVGSFFVVEGTLKESEGSFSTYPKTFSS